MAGMFGSKVEYAGGFKSENAKFSIDGIPSGALVRNIQWSLGRAVSRIWDLTAGNKVYLVAGHPEGAASIAKVAGPKASIMTMLANWDICSPKSIVFNGGHEGDELCQPVNANFTLVDAVPTGVSGSVNSDDFIMSEGITLTFLDITVGGAAAASTAASMSAPRAVASTARAAFSLAPRPSRGGIVTSPIQFMPSSPDTPNIS